MARTETFDANLKKYFNASRGAFSEVTWTEAKDGQVTVSSNEKTIVVEHFGSDDLAKYVGNDTVLAMAGLDARREFRLFPTGRIVQPKLKYPKPNNSELRLYFNDEEFKVKEGHFWGVFERGDDIWLFQATDVFMDRIRKHGLASEDGGSILEPEVDDYQSEINQKAPTQITSTQKAWSRDPKVAAEALKNASFECELYPELPIFTSRSTGYPFMEAHHLIPMKAQADFEVSLDVVDNICCLSPFAHRKLHMAEFDDIIDDLERLIEKRAALLDYANITKDELLGYYMG